MTYEMSDFQKDQTKLRKSAKDGEITDEEFFKEIKKLHKRATETIVKEGNKVFLDTPYGYKEISYVEDNVAYLYDGAVIELTPEEKAYYDFTHEDETREEEPIVESKANEWNEDEWELQEEKRRNHLQHIDKALEDNLKKQKDYRERAKEEGDPNFNNPDLIKERDNLLKQIIDKTSKE